MDKNKKEYSKNPILKTWQEYEFRLYVPKVTNKDNKIEVHFNYLNLSTGKRKQLKKSNGIDRYADKKTYTLQANKLIDELIDLLKIGWNPITNSVPDYNKLTVLSTVEQCIDVWVKLRESDYDVRKIGKGELNLTKNVFNLYKAFLIKNNLSLEKPSFFTVTDVNQFMRYIEKDSNRLRSTPTGKPRRITPLSNPTYNSYLSRLTYFFDFLIIERITTFNPTNGAHRYQTKNLKTRYTIFEDDELENIRTLLSSDPKWIDMLIASHLLYSYRVRGKEQLRIKISFIDFETGLLTFPVEVEERGRLIKATKNGNGATFQLSAKVIALIKDYLRDDIDKPDYFLFGGANKAGPNQKFESYFSNKWDKFRTEYSLPEHLKFYSLKHTSNYNSYQDIGIEGLQKINRHSTPNQTNDYVKHKLKKEIITVKQENEF